MKILLIEDELRVSSFIKKGFEEEGDEVVQAFDGGSGVKLATQYDFDVIILDIVMPVMNGIEVCQKLKQEIGLATPILMLTALGTTDDIVLGLDSGADDYLSKPFKFKELIARVNALSRRSAGTKPDTKVLTVKDLVLDLDTKEVHQNGQMVNLTSKEFRLLEYLLRNKNRVLSRMEILENVWEVDFDMGTNVIDVYVNYLRKKLKASSSEKIISTVIGMGYVIKD